MKTTTHKRSSYCVFTPYYEHRWDQEHPQQQVLSHLTLEILDEVKLSYPMGYGKAIVACKKCMSSRPKRTLQNFNKYDLIVVTNFSSILTLVVSHLFCSMFQVYGWGLEAPRCEIYSWRSKCQEQERMLQQTIIIHDVQIKKTILI